MAWTIVETMDKVANSRVSTGEIIYVVKLACTADANGTDYDLSGETMTKIKGGYIYMVKTRPGAGGDAPTAAYTLDIEDYQDDHLLALTARSTTAVEIEPGSGSIGIYPAIVDQISVVVNDQIGNGNKTDIYIYVTR
jgi:hypothetical protein